MITRDALQSVDRHWAVLSVGDDALRQSVLQYAKAKLVGGTIIGPLSFEFYDLKRLAMAYEVAAIEGMDDFINHTDNDELISQFIAGSSRAFELTIAFGITKDDAQFMFNLLHLSSLACCGDCCSDLWHIYDEFSEDIERLSLEQVVEWDKRILFRLINCWVSLFRKNSWHELTTITSSIAKLRDEQATYEEGYLNADSNNENNAKAMRLMSLYQWAKATELLSLYMLHGEPADIKAQLDAHFHLAIEIAANGGDAQLYVLLRWLHASADKMSNSTK